MDSSPVCHVWPSQGALATDLHESEGPVSRLWAMENVAMIVLERWVRSWWRGLRYSAHQVPMRSHQHYCAEHDNRWSCLDPRCVRHEMVPCRS